jgi:hypothetical protein
LDLYKHLHIGKAPDDRFRQWNSNLLANLIRKWVVAVAGKELHMAWNLVE